MSIYLLALIGIGLVDIGLGFGLVFATGPPMLVNRSMSVLVATGPPVLVNRSMSVSSFATGLPVPVNRSASVWVSSDVPVTCLLIPFTIRPHETVRSPNNDSIMISRQ